MGLASRNACGNAAQGHQYSKAAQAEHGFQPNDLESRGNAVDGVPRHNHKDFMGRGMEVAGGDTWDWYLKPRDGKLAQLKVQTAPNCDRTGNVTWERTDLENITPLSIMLVYWCMDRVLELITQQPTQGLGLMPDGLGHARRGFMNKEGIKKYFGKKWLTIYWRYPLTCVGLLALLSIPGSLEGEYRNGGFYDPVRYRFWLYPKFAKNEREDAPPKGKTAFEAQADKARSRSEKRTKMLVHPLPVISGDVSGQQDPMPADEDDEEYDEDFDDLPSRSSSGSTKKKSGLTKEKGGSEKKKDSAHPLEYLFVSFTHKQIDPKDPSKRKAILKIAEMAARNADVKGFWIDFECMPGHTKYEDVYRICDVVRAAHSLIVVLPSPRVEESLENLLYLWGDRLWTLPELLLCPPKHKISVYVLNVLTPEMELEKRNFAVNAWKDAKNVRQLIDHFESSLPLTPLEIMTIALQCLQTRLEKYRSKQQKLWFDGEMTYILMGLLRRRPPVDEKDSDFEAFARLSLANDSNLLLERLLCMLPPNKNCPWYKIEDSWGCKLWDIIPECQIAGIGPNQTVILDGCKGATIRWKSLLPVAFSRKKTWYRELGKIGLRGTPLWFFIGLITLAATGSHRILGFHGLNPAVIPGLVIFLISMVFVFTSPVLLLATYRGKFWGTQAWFFGIEGEVDLATLEMCLFGADMGRLKWSTSGSVLSNHQIATEPGALERECCALAPGTTASPPAQPTRQGSGIAVTLPRRSRWWNKLWASWKHRKSGPSPESASIEPGMPHHDGEERLFTLVDTYSMTVTQFRSTRPPVAVIICGSEGGMQRAVLCLYDWRTQTFCRETVLRMKTMVVEKMFRVDRFQFSLLNGVRFRATVGNADAMTAEERAAEIAKDAEQSRESQGTSSRPVSGG